MINVMLVDDHHMVRTGLMRVLEEVPGIQVVAEAGSGEQAIEQARSRKPDVVLMDVSMPGIGGLEATRRITGSSPKIRVIVVTVHEDTPFPSCLLEAGASGYITKGCGVEEIIKAIRAVYLGKQYITRDVAEKLAFTLIQHKDRTPLESVTEREMEILLMVVQGFRNKDIARKLCLSPKTVSTLRHRLFERLGVSNDIELTLYAMRHGIVNGVRVH